MNGPFGFAIIDKPAGLTSHDCVNRLRKIFGIRRVGHGGTLDPSVTGVLPIALGNATRLLRYLPGEKTYTGVIQLGKRTSTNDLEGELINEQECPLLSTRLLEKYLDQFRGLINQRPPNISSVNFKGERAYKRSRRGEIFELPLKQVNIMELNLIQWNQQLGQLKIHVHCSSGTYIRSIARDLGELINCGGWLASLRRIQAMGFQESQAVMLPRKNLEQSVKQPIVIPPLTAMQHLPRIELTTEKEILFWRSGRVLEIDSSNRFQSAPKPIFSEKEILADSIIVIDQSGSIAGIASLNNSRMLIPKVVFNAKG